MTAPSIRVSEGSVFPGRPSSDSFQSWVALKLLAQERLALVSAFLGAAVRGTLNDRPFDKSKWGSVFPGRPSSDSFRSWVALQLLAQERLALVSAFLGAAVRGTSIKARYMPFTKLLVLRGRGGMQSISSSKH